MNSKKDRIGTQSSMGPVGLTQLLYRNSYTRAFANL